MTAPAPDVESAPFWAGLAARRVVLQACGRCGRHRFPRGPSCPYCGAPGGADVVVPGTGRVYSWVRVHRPLAPRYGGELPYVVATVTLDSGPRLLGRLEPPERAAVGVRVRPRFVDHPASAERPAWTELRFEPEPPAHCVPGTGHSGLGNARSGDGGSGPG